MIPYSNSLLGNLSPGRIIHPTSFLLRLTYLELSIRRLVIQKYQKTLTKNTKHTHTHTHTKHDLITWCKMLQNKIDFVLGVWMCADECRYVMVDADG